MKKSLLFYLVFLLPVLTFAQKASLRGVVSDANSGETLIGATILYGDNTGVITDTDGKYYIKVDKGTYHLKVSYVGYLPQEMDVVVQKNDVIQDFQLKTPTLTEVEIIGDIAKTRETPVAFTSVSPLKIQEELASRDIPMMLNKTPGVYATQQGGGDGDSRINIRGFSQRNLAVMLDGIPVNDMENGWVYWSNWFGLDMVTRTIQVQRGLSASKLALPAVGGLMNIITKGIDAKPGATIKQEVGSDGFYRTSIGATTGLMKHGWGVTLAASYKQGNGWVDNTWTKGWFFFLRVDKRIGNHTLTLSAMGAPQEHAQRSYKKAIAVYDRDYAKKLGISDQVIHEDSTYGLRYNSDWGYLNRWTRGANGEKIDANTESLSRAKNYFFKPQMSLRDLWKINSNLYWSNIVYSSVGNGGGTTNFSSSNQGEPSGSTFATDPKTGLINYQSAYDFNMNLNDNNPTHRSEKILRSSVNNHYWYGLLSTFNWEINQNFTFSGGLDLRTYKGQHYGEVYDLLGGDFMRDNSNKNVNAYTSNYTVGDKIYYYNDALVRWGGVFAQLEFKKDKWSAFVNLTTALSAYKRVDYFKKKDLVIDDNVFAQAVGFGESFYYNGVDHIKYSEQDGDSRFFFGDTILVIRGHDTASIVNAKEYTNASPEARVAATKWKVFTGYTFKAGANYNIDKRNNIFLNIGYLSKAPRFQNVFDNANIEYLNPKNEIVKAVEVGYSLNTKNISLNLNGYLTIWNNRPLETPIYLTDQSGEKVPANINGIDALHKGLEIQFGWKPFTSLQWDQVVSWGDWRWTSGGRAYSTDDAGNITDSIDFNAKGVHVGDAAQVQIMESLRWEIINSLYVSGSITYFTKNYSQLDPASLKVPRDSWKLPDYFLVDVNAGYRFIFKKFKLDLRASVLNLLDRVYISDAQNNDSYESKTSNFDAASASVFFGMGRRYNVSLAISY